MSYSSNSFYWYTENYNYVFTIKYKEYEIMNSAQNLVDLDTKYTLKLSHSLSPSIKENHKILIDKQDTKENRKQSKEIQQRRSPSSLHS